ncbi:hypothetical protein [Taibaiella soli]|uniref:Catalase n=1 Tax=Taibaiella soli TaxID=1649169 RepID=A0A2W2BGD2_9BACT|nr:hypothetical protein [Taibaiella soli]PZF72556.1 hypothetical protein DN068_11875 [Taibaiella soli]
MAPKFEGKMLKLGNEYPTAEETGDVLNTINYMIAQLARSYPEGGTLRQAHPKMHGCVEAEFKVPELPEHLRVGLFKEPHTYRAFIRFSNSNTRIRNDEKPDIRGFAIKIIEVPGEKLLAGDHAAQTQDFILMSHEVFIAKTVKEFSKSVILLTLPLGLAKARSFFKNFWSNARVIAGLLRAESKCVQALDIPYWSTTPYQFGAQDKAVKYHVKPENDVPIPAGITTGNDLIRQNMVNVLLEREVSFGFYVQFQEDPYKMPIEDATVKWKSPFVKLATITIKRQEFDTAEMNKLGEDMSFSPWHSLPEHRPLGGLNRARKLVYTALANYRRNKNHVPLKETPMEEKLQQVNTNITTSSKDNGMDQNKNEAIVKQLFYDYAHGNAAGVFAAMSNNIVWTEPGAPGVPFGGIHSGIQEVQKMFGMEQALLQILAPLTPTCFFNKDNMVLVQGHDSAKVLATQKIYSTEWVMAFTLADEKIVNVQVYMDTYAIAEAFRADAPVKETVQDGVASVAS